MKSIVHTAPKGKAAPCRFPARPKHGIDPLMRLSGLEPMEYTPNTENMRSTFLYIGERCNVAGSSIYKKVGFGTLLLVSASPLPVTVLTWHMGLMPSSMLTAGHRGWELRQGALDCAQAGKGDRHGG